MKNILKSIRNRASVVSGYAWLFTFSGLILFYAVLILSDIEGLKSYSDSKIFSAYPIIIVGLYLTFLVVNHCYIKRIIGRMYILFVEIVLTIILTISAIITAYHPLYVEFYGFYLRYFYMFVE